MTIWVSYEDIDYSWEELQERFLQRYMEYPKIKNPRFVLQTHTRNLSIHGDLRFQIDEDHLIGWTILLQKCSPEKPPLSKEESKKFIESECNKLRPEPSSVSLRCEPKASQPVAWLDVEGKIPAGQVGATKNYPAFFYIWDRGTYTMGSLKPLFKEYFLHGKVFKNLRVVVRGVQAQKIDPETKKPIKGVYEIMWKFSIPKNQQPYCLSKRARKKEWYPPVGIIPIPEYYVREHRKEVFEWLKWVAPKWGVKIESDSE